MTVTNIIFRQIFTISLRFLKPFLRLLFMVSALGQNDRYNRYISAFLERLLRVTAELIEMVQYDHPTTRCRWPSFWEHYNAGGGLFGNNTTTQQPATGGCLFSNTSTTQQPATSGGLFGQHIHQPTASYEWQPIRQYVHNLAGSGGLFGRTTCQQPGLAVFLGAQRRPLNPAAEVCLRTPNLRPRILAGGCSAVVR